MHKKDIGKTVELKVFPFGTMPVTVTDVVFQEGGNLYYLDGYDLPVNEEDLVFDV